LIAHLYMVKDANKLLGLYKTQQPLDQWRYTHKEIVKAAKTKEGQKVIIRLINEDEARIVRLMLSRQIMDFTIPDKDVQTTYKLLTPESKRIIEQIHETQSADDEEVEVGF